MAKYQQKFDAKAYWATRPLCTVCKNRKVKEGVICGECRKLLERFNEKSGRNKESIIEMDTKNTNEINTETETPNENFGVEVSAEAQNKIVRLFTYLEKALALDDTIVRDFRSSIVAPSPWWLADYPRDLENLFIREFDTEKESENADQSSAWLRIQKKNIEPAPALPDELVEWIIDVTPLDKPRALEKIDRKVRFDSDKERETEFKKFRKDFQQGDELPESLTDWVVLAPNKLPEAIEVKYVPDNWIDHPELEKLLTGYTENEWKRWAEKVKKSIQSQFVIRSTLRASFVAQKRRRYP